jgi:hypothetical protein
MSVDNAKFKLNEKHHYPPEDGFIRGGVLNYEKVKDDRKQSLYQGSVGKCRFPALYSAEEDAMPAKKPYEKKISEEMVLRGKRPLPIPATKPSRPEGVRRIEVASSSDTYELMMPIKRKSENVPSSVEYNMELTMNRKQRVQPGTERNRNYIPVAKPGDKGFGAADREPGFYAKGGLIVGSTIIARQPTGIGVRRAADSDGGQSASKPLSNTKTYMDKLKRMSRDTDVEQVMSLTNGAFKLGQSVPSWEEKSGFYLCNPEDED